MTTANAPTFTASGYTSAGETSTRADRYFTDTVRTAGGLEITLAMVADGAGADNLGQRVAQLAINTVLEYFRVTKNTNPVEMLGKAIDVANRRVHEVAQQNLEKGPVNTTLAVAAIHAGRLYVANVGNSRVYLVRNQQVVQLTMDHTWSYARLKEGILPRDEILRSPEAQKVTRLLGQGRMVQVDLGLYLKGGMESPTQAAQQQGLALGEDDYVVVASDGLMLPSPGGQPAPMALQDIQKAIAGQPPEIAVHKLVDEAPGRKMGDHITAVVIKVPAAAPVVVPAASPMAKAPAQPAARPVIQAAAPLPAAAVPTVAQKPAVQAAKAARPKARGRRGAGLAIILLLLAVAALAGVMGIFVLPRLVQTTDTATPLPPSATLKQALPQFTDTLAPEIKPSDTAIVHTPTLEPSATATNTPEPSATETATPTATETATVTTTNTTTPTLRPPTEVKATDYYETKVPTPELPPYPWP